MATRFKIDVNRAIVVVRVTPGRDVLFIYPIFRDESCRMPDKTENSLEKFYFESGAKKRHGNYRPQIQLFWFSLDCPLRTIQRASHCQPRLLHDVRIDLTNAERAA